MCERRLSFGLCANLSTANDSEHSRHQTSPGHTWSVHGPLPIKTRLSHPKSSLTLTARILSTLGFVGRERTPSHGDPAHTECACGLGGLLRPVHCSNLFLSCDGHSAARAFFSLLRTSNPNLIFVQKNLALTGFCIATFTPQISFRVVNMRAARDHHYV